MSNIKREDGSIVRCYAPGDGHLSFNLDYEGPSRSYDITEAEAQRACPYGWIVYRDGPYYRARPAA